MHHTDVLVKQAALFDFWFTPSGIDYLARLCHRDFPPEELFARSGTLYDKTVWELALGTPVYVTAPACDLLAEVAPRWHARFTLRQADVPLPRAWVWFARALPVHPELPDRDWPLRAISWISTELATGEGRAPEPLLADSFYCDLPRTEPAAATHDLPLLMDSTGWFYGDEEAGLDAPFAGHGGEVTRAECRKRLTRHLVTLISALRQGVLVLRSEPVSTRQLRRWPVELPRPDSIQVIHPRDDERWSNEREGSRGACARRRRRPTAVAGSRRDDGRIKPGAVLAPLAAPSRLFHCHNRPHRRGEPVVTGDATVRGHRVTPLP